MLQSLLVVAPKADKLTFLVLKNKRYKHFTTKPLSHSGSVSFSYTVSRLREDAKAK